MNKSVTLCPECNLCLLTGDLTTLDFHHDSETSKDAADVIGNIPFNADGSPGTQWDHTCCACGTCDRYADLMGDGMTTTVYTFSL